ncbi:hypothetical protein C1S70_19555 [Azospirillum argentinense]|uniref:Helix-turn-helix domain-containing protein n=1 Tax=Azospirillum argentinense TaxID=2970906 RepID=A0A2K1FXN7_9PROT|nr:helix-turn-helix domain-containing protein [Azospirillum argentinense]PNQ97305.1 hypothetical protein C1S70_19555 [Azospirillum argentinense]
MSIKVQQAVWTSPREMDGLTKFVLVRLAFFADDGGGSIFPSIGRVAADCQIGERTVRNAFRSLEAAGILVMVTKEDAARHKARVYRIDLDALTTLGTVCRPAPHAARYDVPPSPAPCAAAPRHRLPPISHEQASGKDQTLFGDIEEPKVEAIQPIAPKKPKPADTTEAEFREWYAAYPLKKDPKKALTAYRMARKGGPPSPSFWTAPAATPPRCKQSAENGSSSNIRHPG